MLGGPTAAPEIYHEQMPIAPWPKPGLFAQVEDTLLRSLDRYLDSRVRKFCAV